MKKHSACARPRSRSRFGNTSGWWKPPSKKAPGKLGAAGGRVAAFHVFFCKQNNFWWPTKRELKSSQSSIQRRFEGTFNESKIESDTIDLSETPQIPTRMSLGPLVTGGRDLDAGMVAKVARHFISNVKIQISSSADIRSIWALP